MGHKGNTRNYMWHYKVTQGMQQLFGVQTAKKNNQKHFGLKCLDVFLCPTNSQLKNILFKIISDREKQHIFTQETFVG